jgi:arsenite methyltransferase
MNKQADDVRAHVSEAYARAVTESGGCCGDRQPKGAVTKLTRYEDGELDSLPAEAVINSFGCGNPVSFTGVREGDTVLDLGSGAGIDLLLAARKVGPSGRVIGVDMTDAMIAKARENIADAGAANVDVRKGLIESLPVESGTVDWVISNCVINLSPEKDKVFAEIARVLKPGGRMLVSDLVVEGVPDWVRQDRSLYNSCVAGAVSEREYLDGVTRAGLVDAEIRARVVYDAGNLEAFVDSEREETGGGCGCGGKAAVASTPELARALEGKVQSVMVYARRPN